MADTHLGGLAALTPPHGAKLLAEPPGGGRLRQIEFSVLGLEPVAVTGSTSPYVASTGHHYLVTTDPGAVELAINLPDATSERVGHLLAVSLTVKSAQGHYLFLTPVTGQTINGGLLPVPVVDEGDLVVLRVDGVGAWTVVGQARIHERFSGTYEHALPTYAIDELTREITVTPSGTLCPLWSRGKAIGVGELTKTFADTEGVHFVYVDEEGVLQETTVFDISLIDRYALILEFYWDVDNQVAVVLGDERHGSLMPPSVHSWAHRAFGTLYESGLALTDIVADGDGSSDTHAQLGYESGVILDEDLTIAIGAAAAPADVPILYRLGADGNWRVAGTISNILAATAGSGRAAWNEFTGGAWQLTEVSNGKFVLLHLVATNDARYPLMGLVGQAEYGTKAEAQAGALTEFQALSIGPLQALYTEFSEVGTLILQTSNGYANTAKTRIVSTEDGGDYVDFRGAFQGAGAGAAAGESASKPFVLIPSVYGTMEDDMIIMDFVVPESFTIPIGAPLSSGRVFGDQATAEAVVSILKDDVEVATITFPAAGSIAVAAAPADAFFQQGVSRMTIKGPATADATLAGFSMVIRGIRES
jgi:hypothetical protein